MTSRTRKKGRLLCVSVAVAIATFSLAARAETDTTSTTTVNAAGAANPLSLRQAFDSAWARQPEAMALQARREAARAQAMAAEAWTPEPAAVEISSKTDRLSGNQGAREWELAIGVPLWLPGQRRSSVVLAEAESAAIESRAIAAKLRLASSVRDAWWQWQRARVEVGTARDQADSTRVIAADVARRAKAGDLARADQHQADGAVASAEAALAQAEAGLAVARQQLRALAGSAPAVSEVAEALSEPDPGDAVADFETHAALQDLKDRAAVAERIVTLITSQSRANPELILATTLDRSVRGESSKKTVTLGIRIPFGAGPRVDARRANALAEATEAQAQLILDRERLTSEREAARVQVEATRKQLAAASRRAQLARESRGFFDKAFRLGEADLPTRLRVETEAAEADKQAARARIELSAAISAWRQALGLLPQ